MKRVFAALLLLAVVVTLFSGCKHSTPEQETVKRNSSGTVGNISGDATMTNEPTGDTTFSGETTEKVFEAKDLAYYVGMWHDSARKMDDLRIFPVENNKFKCELGIFRITTLDLTAAIENGKVTFYDDDDMLFGRIVFKPDSILVIFDRSYFSSVQSGMSYLFTYRADYGGK